MPNIGDALHGLFSVVLGTRGLSRLLGRQEEGRLGKWCSVNYDGAVVRRSPSHLSTSAGRAQPRYKLRDIILVTYLPSTEVHSLVPELECRLGWMDGGEHDVTADDCVKLREPGEQ